MSAEQGKNGGGVPGWLVAPVAGVAAFAAAPPLVQAAVVGVVLAVVLVFALAYAHGMSVRAAAALYGGRAVLAVAKVLAVVCVEWPLRGVHRVWVRFDVPLRAGLGAVRAGEVTRTVGLAALARVRRQTQPVIEARAEVLALPPAPAPSTAPVSLVRDTHAA